MRTIQICILIAAVTLSLLLMQSASVRAAYPCPRGYSYYGGQCVPNNAFPTPNPWGNQGYYGRWGPYGPRSKNKDRSGCAASLLACQQQCEAMRPNMTRQNYIQCRQTCQMGFDACVY